MQNALLATVFVAYFGVQAQSIVVASTTSTEQVCLFAHLLPGLKKPAALT
jgi:ABC-type tungstate transport system permease subunit